MTRKLIAIGSTTAVVWMGLVGFAVASTVSFKPAQNYTVGTNPTSVAVGDFDSDGKPDLAVVNSGDSTVGDNGTVSILLGNGDGTFQTAVNFTDGNNPTSVAAGDFNGDGKDDLVVLRSGTSGSDTGDVTIFISNGDGTFRKGQVISTVANPVSVVATDLDSDGNVDLAISDLAGDSVTVTLGDGDGTFRGRVSYATPSTISIPKIVKILDFNHDGKKDLGVTGLRTAEVLLGNGDGTFQSAFGIGTFTSLQVPQFVADFNHDGNVDVVLSSCQVFHGCNESLLLMKADGTLSAPPGTNVLQAGANITADFDGDGNPDLAGRSSINGSGVITIYLGNGDGSFQQPLTFPLISDVFKSIAMATDLNGDKAADLIVTNSDGSVSIILNSGTDFSLSATPPSPATIGGGQTATSTITLELLSAFDNPVSLSCAVQPSQLGAPACSFSSNLLMFDQSGKASATLKIAFSAALLARGDSRAAPFESLWHPVWSFAFLGTGFGIGLSRRRKMLVYLLASAMFSALVPQIACGGGGNGVAKSTNYAVTITGTSGQMSHSTTVNVSVQ